MAKILLMGAAGFIGSQVYKGLSQRHELVGIDNLSAFSNYQIKLDRLSDIAGGNIEWDENQQLKSKNHIFYCVDITDRNHLNKILSQYKFDAVIHLAAMTGVRQSSTNPGIYEQSNIIGFINLLDLCKANGVRKIIYASSSSVYGANKEVPFRENAAIETPLNYYAVTKRMNELAAAEYSASYDMQLIGLRFFTVYGPWTRPDMATYSFIKNIIEGKPITLFNNGNMERDFTYVGDIVQAISLVLDKMTAGSEQRASHNIFNIGEGTPVNIRQYIEILERKLGRKAIIQNAPMNSDEMVMTFADCSKLFSFIGFKPATTVEEGLDKTVAWFLDYQKGAADQIE